MTGPKNDDIICCFSLLLCSYPSTVNGLQLAFTGKLYYKTRSWNCVS